MAGRLLSTGLFLALFLALACKRPEAVLRERPVQQVEVRQSLQGMTLEEEARLATHLGEGLGQGNNPPATIEAPTRIFRITLKGEPNPDVGRGVGKTTLVMAGQGLLLGAFIASGIPVMTFTSVKVTAIGAGLGGVLGLGYGPTRFLDNEAMQRENGYLPWVLSAEWEVLERAPGKLEATLARRRHARVDVRPFLRPIPFERRSDAAVREATLDAYAEAVVAHFRASY